MNRLIDTLRQVLEGYTGEALNGYSYLTESKDGAVFTVVSAGYLPDRRIVDAGLIVRLMGDRIAIDAINAAVVGLMEIENNGYGPESAVQDLVNGLNSATGNYAF